MLGGLKAWKLGSMKDRKSKTDFKTSSAVQLQIRVQYLIMKPAVNKVFNHPGTFNRLSHGHEMAGIGDGY